MANKLRQRIQRLINKLFHKAERGIFINEAYIAKIACRVGQVLLMNAINTNECAIQISYSGTGPRCVKLICGLEPVAQAEARYESDEEERLGLLVRALGYIGVRIPRDVAGAFGLPTKHPRWVSLERKLAPVRGCTARFWPDFRKRALEKLRFGQKPG